MGRHQVRLGAVGRRTKVKRHVPRQPLGFDTRSHQRGPSMGHERNDADRAHGRFSSRSPTTHGYVPFFVILRFLPLIGGCVLI